LREGELNARETIIKGPPKLHNKFFLSLRWTARVLASLLAMFFLLMVIGYAVDSNPDAEQRADILTQVLLLTLFITWIIGTMLAWRWEGIGGGIILVSTIIFFIRVPDAFTTLNLLHLLPAIGILFLICWWKARTAC
jgi:hypothetical protein